MVSVAHETIIENFILLTLLREEVYPGSLSYSYSYDSVSKNDVHPEYETDVEEGKELVVTVSNEIFLNETVESGDDIDESADVEPLNATVESGDDIDESADVEPFNATVESGDDIDESADVETVSSLTSEEENSDQSVALLSEAVAGNGSTSSLTKTMIGLGVGCATIVAFLALKRQRRFADDMSA